MVWSKCNDIRCSHSELAFIKTGKLAQNVFIERFNQIDWTKTLDFYPFGMLAAVKKRTEYNGERLYGFLNRLLPEKYQIADNCAET